VKQTDSLRNTTIIDYHLPAVGTTKVTNALSAAIQHTHPKLANSTGYTDSAGQTVTYDTHNRRTLVTDRFGDKTTITRITNRPDSRPRRPTRSATPQATPSLPRPRARSRSTT